MQKKVRCKSCLRVRQMGEVWQKFCSPNCQENGRLQHGKIVYLYRKCLFCGKAGGWWCAEHKDMLNRRLQGCAIWPIVRRKL